MAGYTTIGQLIKNLQDENPDAPVIYQYYLGEHFEVSDEVFADVAEKFDSVIPCSDAYEIISNAVK